jgi:hypothetical protein
MTDPLTDDLGIDASVQRQRGVGMPEIVQPDGR